MMVLWWFDAIAVGIVVWLCYRAWRCYRELIGMARTTMTDEQLARLRRAALATDCEEEHDARHESDNAG